MPLVVGEGTGVASADLPSPQELPPRVIAVVIGVPAGLEAIHRSEFDREMMRLAIAEPVKAPPRPGERRYAKVKGTLDYLLERRWIAGQGAEMGIKVTPRQIAVKFAQTRRIFSSPTPNTRGISRPLISRRPKSMNR
jgi:hypothetical protein